MASLASSGLLGFPASFTGGGATLFGFEIPRGDPGAVAAAADGLRRLGAELAAQGRALGAGARVALGGGAWGGSAASAYASYSGHLVSVCSANASACERCGSVLRSFAHELAHAQQVTRQALADCEHFKGELSTQQGIASAAGQAAQTASLNAASAPHPSTRAAFQHQATQAQQDQAAAQKAAGAAQGELDAAERRGRHAFEAYQHEAQATSGRLESAAGELRPVPMLSGGAPVPVSVTPGDVTLAQSMMAAGLPAATGGLSDPSKLGNLARGPVSPGAALQFTQDYRNAQHLAQIIRDDKPLDGSVAGVIPGPVGKFLGGAWDTTKATGGLIVSGVTNPGTIAPSIAGYVSYAVNHPGDWVKQTIDWQDWSHGRPERALGVLAAGALEAKGAGRVVRGIPAAARYLKDNPAARPAATQAGGDLAGALGVPHAGDAAKLIGPFTSNSLGEVRAGVQELPHHVLVSVAALIQTPRVVPLIDQALAKSRQYPTVVVVQQQAAPRVRYHPPAVVRRYPRAR